MKERKRRKDSFWGIHSDFHAKPDYGPMGKNLKEEEIREICRLLKPDYWQIDSKGHYGWASYPSEIGNGVPEHDCDVLEMYRRVTAEEGVALYVHHSGLWDSKYAWEHPEERFMNADGSILPNERPDKATEDTIRPTSRYVDEVLIPQILEIAGKYGADGVWMDGDCWAMRPDFRPDTLEAFEKETGIDLKGNLPAAPGDPYYHEFREYNRELFRRYVRHYTDVIHEKYPDFQICTNWYYSQTSPEPVTAKVDFLSGDLDGQNSISGGRYCARALAQNGLPWDLMSWGMRGFNPGHLDFIRKHNVQLMQEAAAVISLGGGYEEIISQEWDGSPDMPWLRTLVPLMEFVRAREPYCFKGKFIHQAALFWSCHDLYHESRYLFGGGNVFSKKGMTDILCDIGQSLEIASEHTLKEHYGDYKMIVVPEVQAEYKKETVEELLDYTKKGGSLLLIGPKTCKVFSEAGAPFKVRIVRDEEVLPTRRMCRVNDENAQRSFTMDEQVFGEVFTPVEILCEDGEVIASTCYTRHTARHPLAVIMNYGKGKIAAVGSDIGTEYCNDRQYLHRTLIRTIADKLYTPKARIESALGIVELTCLEKNGRLMLQMTNCNGSHTNTAVATDDMIPPAVDIKISITCDQKPEKLLLQPGNKELSFEYRDGRVYVAIDRIDIHNVIEVYQAPTRKEVK